MTREIFPLDHLEKHTRHSQTGTFRSFQTVTFRQEFWVGRRDSVETCRFIISRVGTCKVDVPLGLW